MWQDIHCDLIVNTLHPSPLQPSHHPVALLHNIAYDQSGSAACFGCSSPNTQFTV
jgi:hypothetical protein